MPRPAKTIRTNYFEYFYSGVKKLFIYLLLETLAFLASSGAATLSAGAAWEGVVRKDKEDRSRTRGIAQGQGG